MVDWTYRILHDYFRVSQGEEILVLTDPRKEDLARKLYETARHEHLDAALMIVRARHRHGEEPPRHAAEAMKGADVVAAITSWSITHTDARKRACEAGTRVATMPGLTEGTARRAIDIDPRPMRKITRRLADALTEASEAELITEEGCRLTMELEGREAIPDDGDLSKPGSFGNLPAGEAFIAPVEGTAEGQIAVRSVAPDGLMDEPVVITVEEGRLVDVEPENLEFSLLVKETENGDWLAELGVGTNPGAKLVGLVLEDEKVYGTAHVAFGDNHTFGGEIESDVHLDVVAVKPTLKLDGKTVVRGGKLKV